MITSVIIDLCTWRKGIVVQESVARLKEQLVKLQKLKGLTSEEKGEVKSISFSVIVYSCTYYICQYIGVY